MKIAGNEGYEAAAKRGEASLFPGTTRITVGMATCGIASGAKPVYEALVAAIAKTGLDAVVTRTGCVGFCQQEPLVDVLLPGTCKVTYGHMTAARAHELVAALADGTGLQREGAIYRTARRAGEPAPAGLDTVPLFGQHPFFKSQMRVVLENCGLISPESIDEYIACGGYAAWRKTLAGMTPEDVIAAVTRSGLRGRGGAGFPTGKKWNICRGSPGDEKYVICNADEGDPGAFMDRSVMEGNPHAVLEGMLIGAYAIGASKGIAYVRAEYPMAIAHLTTAIRQAREQGFLGDDILGSGFSFDLEIFTGAGAFVCGEETALIASLQGEIGNPRPRPPYPASAGFKGKPTNINNVETWANVPIIIQRGADEFAGIGTEKSKGTKVFSLVGKVRCTGLVEVPMGMPLRQIVYDIGGGPTRGRTFKAVQTGGPSGGCIPESLIDLPVDFDALVQAGGMMGSGGLIVMDDHTCMVDVARYFTDFLVGESCGKCTPCREGLRHMLDILTAICAGRGTEADLATLERLAQGVKHGSLCALGGTAPNPVLSTLKHFRHEYEAHILQKKCPAGVCKAITRFVVVDALCKGCGKCATECPVGAIGGQPKAVHVLDQTRCTVCGVCYGLCPFNAIQIDMQGVNSGHANAHDG